MNELLCEVLSICHEISVNSSADVFFEYMPHCDAFEVRMYPQGWKLGEDAKKITEDVERITEENLKNAIFYLKSIAIFMEVKL